ncbi:MAG: hypothetical protein QG649_276 [Patescibacteria group bacterium]|nr:hypothetical protein [Patescibacteria group bacterium]
MESTTTTTLDPTTLDQSTLQNMLGGSTPSLIPESFMETLVPILGALSVFSILFFVLFLINMVRKWKVDSAILHLRKDVAEIKIQLASKPAHAEPSHSPQLSPPPVTPAAPSETEPSTSQIPPATPAARNQVIAEDDTSSTTDTRLS